MKTGKKAFLITLWSLVSGAVCFAIEAKVTSVTGKVQKQAANSSEWLEVKTNDILEQGTIISTGFNSTVTLNIDGSICTLQALSRMSIEQLSQKDVVQDGQNKTVTKTAIFVDTGKATFKVNSTDKKLNDFKVRSPAATASVRGTEFTFYSAGTVETQQGLVGVSSGNTRRSLSSESDDYFVPPSGKASVFTPTENVGGEQNSIPVYAGQRITVDALTTVRSDPSVQRQQDARWLPGSTTAHLAEREKIVSAAAPIPELPHGDEKKAFDSDSSSTSTKTSIKISIDVND